MYWCQFCHHKPVEPLYSTRLAPYSYGTVPRWHRAATVQSCPGTVQWLYSEDVGPLISANLKRMMYGKGPRHTVAVQLTCGTDCTAAVRGHR